MQRRQTQGTHTVIETHIAPHRLQQPQHNQYGQVHRQNFRLAKHKQQHNSKGRGMKPCEQCMRIAAHIQPPCPAQAMPHIMVNHTLPLGGLRTVRNILPHNGIGMQAYRRVATTGVPVYSQLHGTITQFCPIHQTTVLHKEWFVVQQICCISLYQFMLVRPSKQQHLTPQMQKTMLKQQRPSRNCIVCNTRNDMLAFTDSASHTCQPMRALRRAIKIAEQHPIVLCSPYAQCNSQVMHTDIQPIGRNDTSGQIRISMLHISKILLHGIRRLLLTDHNYLKRRIMLPQEQRKSATQTSLIALKHECYTDRNFCWTGLCKCCTPYTITQRTVTEVAQHTNSPHRHIAPKSLRRQRECCPKVRQMLLQHANRLNIL